MRKGLALMGSFWFGAAMGAAAVVLALLAASPFSGLLHTAPNNLLYHYQTLIAGIGALLAALLTVIAIWQQINQQYELEDTRRVRQNAAARTVLPTALSDLSQYAQDCVGHLVKIKEYRTAEQIMYPDLSDQSFVTAPGRMLDNFPLPPSSLLSVFSRCVETADELPAREISALTAAIQIQSSRLQSLAGDSDERFDENRLILVHRLDNLILDAVEIHARASNLFSFARTGYSPDDFAPNRGIMRTSLFLCKIDDDDDEYKFIWDSMRRIYPEDNKSS